MIGDMGNKRNVECVTGEREKNEAFSLSHSRSLMRVHPMSWKIRFGFVQGAENVLNVLDVTAIVAV